MTIDEIKALCADSPSPSPAVDQNAPNGDMRRLWWVVAVNPRRQPPVPKFYTGHVSKASAEAMVAAQQKIADDQAAKETEIRGKEWKPFRYFAIEAPPTGKCPNCGAKVDIVRTYTGVICEKCEEKQRRGVL